jgi:hypothetical protein
LKKQRLASPPLDASDTLTILKNRLEMKKVITTCCQSKEDEELKTKNKTNH